MTLRRDASPRVLTLWNLFQEPGGGMTWGHILSFFLVGETGKEGRNGNPFKTDCLGLILHLWLSDVTTFIKMMSPFTLLSEPATAGQLSFLLVIQWSLPPPSSPIWTGSLQSGLLRCPTM